MVIEFLNSYVNSQHKKWSFPLRISSGLMVPQNSLFQLYCLRVIYCNIFSFLFCKVHYRNWFLSYMPSNWCLLFFKHLFYNSVHFTIASLTILVKMVLTKYKIWEAIKGAVTDMRYFARNKFSRSLVHKKNFSLIWQVVFELGYVFCQER